MARMDDLLRSKANEGTITKSLVTALLCGISTAALAPYSDTFPGAVLTAGCVFATFSCAVQGARTWRDDLKRRRQLIRFASEGSGSHTGRWATDADLEAAGMFLPLGRPLGVTFSGRVFFEPVKPKRGSSVAPAVNGKLMAPPGFGKTTAAVVQTVMHYALMRERSVVLPDPKDGEVTAQIAGPLRRLGIDVIVLDDLGTTGLPADELNFLGPIVDAVGRNDPMASSMARLVALTMEPEPQDGDQKSRWFRDGPRDVIVVAILSLAAIAPEDCTGSGVWQLLADPEMFEQALERAIANGGALGALAQRVLDLKTEDPRHYVDFLSTARRKFDVFEEGGPLWEKGRGAVRRHGDIKSGERPVVVCIVGAQRHMRDLAPYYTLQLAAFMQEATRVGGRKTAFVIDEAPRFPLQALIEDQTVLRGYGASMLFVAQSPADIEKRFGDKSARILDDVCSLHQIMGVASFAEAKRISEALGRETYVARSMNASGEKPDVGFGLSDLGRPLMTPEQVMAMPKDEQIIFIQGLPPIRAKKLYQNQIAPICHLLDANLMEGGKLTPDPIIEIHYDEVKP